MIISTGTLPKLLALFLLYLTAGSPPAFVSAQDMTNNTKDPATVTVNCSPTKREFTALTEMLLDGRKTLLELAERKMLKSLFMGIYNGLTTRDCDSFHRKILQVNFVQMQNSDNERYSYQDMLDNNNVTLSANESQVLEEFFQQADTTLQQGNSNNGTTRHRRLQRQTDVNTTAVGPPADVSITYEVVGTCRDCPVTETGAFELYDDAFRRALSLTSIANHQPFEGVQIRLRTRMLRVRELQDGTNNHNTNNTNTDDCVCLPGVDPTPQAPGVAECVDLMNEQLPVVANETGLLQNLSLQTLLQLDDPSSLVEETAEPEGIVEEETESELELELEDENWDDSTTTEVRQTETDHHHPALAHKIWTRRGNNRRE